MNKNRVIAMSTCIAIALIAMMLSSVYAYNVWNFDTKSGMYTTANVGVAGNLISMKLYNPAAYVKGVVDKDLPSGHTLIIQYHFEWTDLNHVTHTQDGIVTSSCNKAGEYIRIDLNGLPSVVYDIVAECRTAWNTTTYDTDWASASLPWV